MRLSVAFAVANVRAGEAAGRAAAIIRQMHGAVGFTHEHSLHRLLGGRGATSLATSPGGRETSAAG